jgi:acetyl esterase/lipase
MTTATLSAADTWPGFTIQAMDQPRARLHPARVLGRLRNRVTQVLVDTLMLEGVVLRDRDPAAFDRFLQRWRRTYSRLDAPAKASVFEAEAVRRAGPSVNSLPPVPSEWFAPRLGEPRGYVFYVHGGSFIAERSPRVTALVARLSAAAGAQVFAPNYRLAPEHPCPAAVEDIVSAFEWFSAVWPDEPVVALAESAGAAILLAALQGLKARGAAMPEGVILLSPWVDLSLQSWSVVAASLAGSTPYT